MLGDQRHKAVVGSKLIEDIVGVKSTCSQNPGCPDGAADPHRLPGISGLPCAQSDDFEYRIYL